FSIHILFNNGFSILLHVLIGFFRSHSILLCGSAMAHAGFNIQLAVRVLYKERYPFSPTKTGCKDRNK
ncbi:MAG: hypothetical protein WCO44_13565, partial [Bacteroidota bacterium]